MTRRSKNRKEEIYIEAAKLFGEKGYAGTSIRDIAEQVGIEPGSLYSHISGKEEILKAICMPCADIFSRGMDEIMSIDCDPLRKIEMLIDLHLDVSINHPESITVFNDEWRYLAPDDLKEFLKARKKYQKGFTSLIDRVLKDKNVRKTNAKIVFLMIINSLKWTHYYAREGKINTIARNRNTVKKFLLQSLWK